MTRWPHSMHYLEPEFEIPFERAICADSNGRTQVDTHAAEHDATVFDLELAEFGIRFPVAHDLRIDRQPAGLRGPPHEVEIGLGLVDVIACRVPGIGNLLLQ